MPTFEHDQITFHYRETGEGLPFIFQHGLGGSVDQPFSVLVPPAGVRMIAFDTRGHGLSQPLGPPERISLSTFADDLLALMEHLRIERAIVGGISMGAAITLNFTLRYPERVLGLVQSRPAFLERAEPWSIRTFTLVAQLIREYGPQEAKVRFEASELYQEVLASSPESAASLLRQFENPRIMDQVVLYERIPLDQPQHRLADLARIRVPTLVLANRQDPVHPYEVGEALARLIPGAELVELTPKSVDRDAHGRDVQRAIERFLQQFPSGA
mgnify:CR=1 FL=1